ncbi:MAG TPA: ABC transporter permease [Candidatus Dependentiae bacterium]|nr:ABC transporter permease [Candidatus Dependentiae bacterium]
MNINMKSFCLPLFVTLFFLFLYVPIIVLILYSFNASTMPYEWKGFTTMWYKQLFASKEAWQALSNSLIVSTASVFLSVTMAVLVVYNGFEKFNRFFVMFYGTLVVPEIVLAVGLLGFFSLFSVSLGLATLIAGHTLLGLGYAVPIIYSRFCELERHLTEASLDLGATRSQTFFRVILPLLMPSVFAASLLVFVISLDDFLIAFFCAGAETQTLPLYIFSVVRSGGSPMVNALSTIMIFVGALIVSFIALLQARKVVTIV